MAGLPLTLAGDDESPDKPHSDTPLTGASAPPPAPSAPQTQVPAARELTVRALAMGLAIGALLAAGNVYTGLKSGFIDGGALTAVLLSFTFFATFKGLARLPFGPFENNIAQTAAASAAVMGFVHGLMGPMPALMLMGHGTPAWALWTWGIALGFIGLAIGVFLRRKLIVEDALPFPTGLATAELITTVHGDRTSATRRTRFLLAAAVAAALLTWLRDGGSGLVPQTVYLPLTIGGVSAASLTLGIAPSPLMAATGMFVGLRVALSLLFGGVVAWGIAAPLALRAGWVPDASYTALSAWLVWPALGMMLASTVMPLFLGWRTVARVLARVLRDARRFWRPAPALGSRGAASQSRPGTLIMGGVVVLLAAATVTWTGWRAFGFSPALTGVALILSVVLSSICARAAGETDLAPVGSFGTLTQILFSGAGPKASLLSAAVVAGNAAEVAQTLWGFKAGHNLRASVRGQIVAQLLGAIVGSLVVVPAYLLIIRVYPLGSERMPAVSAMSWKATAIAMSGGLGHLPPHALHAAGVAFAIGAALSALERTRIGKLLPSAMALGIAVITPVSLSAAAALGAGLIVLGRRRFATLADGECNALAAGLLAGESILGVLIAALTA